MSVVEGGGLCASRNKCIELAKRDGKLCVEISDDIYRMEILHYPVGNIFVLRSSAICEQNGQNESNYCGLTS